MFIWTLNWILCKKSASERCLSISETPCTVLFFNVYLKGFNKQTCDTKFYQIDVIVKFTNVITTCTVGI